MMKTLKALSALLTYPTAELAAAVPEIRETLLSEDILGHAAREALEPLLSSLAGEDLYDLQERYIQLFDRTRALSLHLFEHVHGESRDRGQAMVDLKHLYSEGGLEIASSELPDYVPLFLEYCSLQPHAEARALLAEPVHVLGSLAERLRLKGSPYAAPFEAVLALAAAQPTAEALEAIVSDPGSDPDDLAALDAAWEEEEVRFGPGAATSGCGVDSLSARLRQARRPAPGLEVTASRNPQTVFNYVPSRV
jgi:nitrate reductase molybdenum cofactor assembly chaperone NarJ/NarW